MATFEEIMGGVVNALPTSSAASAADPYGANLYQRSGESLYDYFSRIRGAEDRAGLLGWRLGAKDKALGLEAEEVNAADELGKLIKKQTGAAASAATGSSGSSGSSDPFPSAKEVSLEDMARQMSGVDFDPTILMNAIPGVGTVAGSIAGYLRSREVQSRLKDMGYTEAQIEAMIDNPSILMSELGTNVNAGFVKEFDPLAIDGRGLITRLTDGLGLTDRTNLDVVASKAGLFGPHTADVMMREMAADPLLRSATTAQAPAVAGAQAAVARDAAIQAEIARAVRQEELDNQAAALRARQAAQVSMTTPSSEQGMFSGGAINIGSPVSDNGSLTGVTVGGPIAPVPSFSSSSSSYSPSYSTTNYASSGGTQTVGSGGGNASRGYSYGGW